MATNFNSLGGIAKIGFSLKRRFRSLLVPQTSINFIGLGISSNKVTLNFDLIPVLTSNAAIYSNWAITGGTIITVNSVTVVGNSIEISFSGVFDGNDYTVMLPSGITADSGVSGFPYPYLGPTSIAIETSGITSNITLLTTTPFANGVVVQFSDNISLLPTGSLASNWVITGPTVVTVNSVTALADEITINSSEMLAGQNYTLVIPGSFISDPSGYPYGGPFTVNFTAVATPPIAISANWIDSNTVEITFSEAVNHTDATSPLNYNISPSISVLSVSQKTQSIYVIKTSSQDANILYTITVNNIRDLAGNII